MKRNPVTGHVPYHGLGHYQSKTERERAPVASVNKVILVGNLGKDPELKYTQSGTAFCNFSIATTDRWNDANGQPQEKTEWHRVTTWKKQAENCAKYLRKGSSAYVEGRLSTRSWDDDRGQKRYSTEIIAENVKFLGSAAGARSDPQQPDPVYDPAPEGFVDNIPF